VHHSGKRRSGDSVKDSYERSVEHVQAPTSLFRSSNLDALNNPDTVTVVTASVARTTTSLPSPRTSSRRGHRDHHGRARRGDSRR
jgi:hypothetical protein